MSVDDGKTDRDDADPTSALREDETVVYDRLHDADELPGERQTAMGTASGSVATIQEFSQALVDLGLIEAAELEKLAVESPQGVLGLSRALVSAGRLTRYQAAALYQRKSRGLLIGDYLILDKLGQGGMGVVFKARHRKHGRIGALKILPPSFARDHQAVMRFRREVEAASRLKHPNLVAAFDADEDRGVNFLVMDFVDGRDLDRVVDEQGPLPIHQAIDYLIQAARGLEAAHAQGIIHRDIKPGNLILDRAGTVRVLDLGLARFVDATNPFNKTVAGRLTQSGMSMGTVDYMAPEQAEDAHRVDHRADIYSLGCTLYFLLTGREPFPGETILKRLMAHLERPAPSLRASRPDVPIAIDDCYQRMMAKRPEDRPDSMTEVIALLQKPKLPTDFTVERVAPPRDSRPELITFNETPLRAPRLPKTELDPVIIPRREEREGLAISQEFNLEDLEMEVRPGVPSNAPEAASPMERLPSRSAKPAFRAWARQAGLAIVAVAAVGIILVGVFGFLIVRRPASVVEKENWPPISNGSASANTQPHMPGEQIPDAPREQTIFDGASRAGWMLCNRAPVPLRNIQADGLNPHLAGTYLVVYEHKLGDFVLDLDYKLSKGCNSGVFLRVSDLNDPVHTGIKVALNDSRRGDDHDSGAFNGLVAPTAYTQRPAGEWNHMTITARGPSLAVSLNGTEVSSIDLDSWTVAGKRPDGSDHDFKDLVVAQTARFGYLGFQDLGGDCWFKNIVLKNPSVAPGLTLSSSIASRATPAPSRQPGTSSEPFVEIGRFAGHAHPWVEGISVLPDGKSLLTSCYDKTARLWNVATGREIRTLWHPAALRPVAALPDGRRAVTGCNDGLVRLWDLATGHEVRRLVKHTGPVNTIAISPDGRLVISGGADKTLRLVNIDTGQEIRTVPGLSAEIIAVAFSPSGERFLVGGDDGIVRWGEAERNGPLAVLTGHFARVWDLTFARDSRHAVTTDQDGRLIYWDLDAQKIVRQAKVQDCTIRCVAIEADGRHLVFGGAVNDRNMATVNGFMGYWDLASDNPPRLTRGGFAHLGMSRLPGGELATSDNMGIARIWARSPAISHARELSTARKGGEALAEYRKAMGHRLDNPWLLVERGQLLAELGRFSEADADFTRAARLAPDNPQVFLDAGWWIAGPYAADLKTKTPIESESDPDPSRPPPPAGNEPRVWHHAPSGILGHVDLRKTINADNVAGYALSV